MQHVLQQQRTVTSDSPLSIAGSNSSPGTTQSHFEDLKFNDDGTKMYTLGYASGVCWKRC